MDQARFQDGRSTASHPVELEWGEAGLRIRALADGAVLAEWPFAEIRLFEMPGSEDLMRLGLGHDAAERLLLRDAQDRYNVRLRCDHLHRKRERERGWWRGYAFWGSGALLSVTGLFMFVIPALAGFLATLVPAQWEARLGTRVEEQIIRILAREDESADAAICRSVGGNRALKSLMASFAALEPEAADYHVSVVDSKMPNALALPGKRILILRGLLDLAENPNEVAGVLAHEMGHVKENHAMEQLIQSSATSILLGLVLGDVTGGAVVVGAGELAINAAYSRDKEREADRYALNLMHKGGYDAAPLADMLQSLEEEAGSMPAILDWASSHPDMAERVGEIRAKAVPGSPVMGAADWKALKNICSSKSG